MTQDAARPGDERALVAGELRGFRQFELRPDGLYPLVHDRTGPWDGTLHRARCSTGADHDAPSADCRCGLYAWYLPGSATVALGPVSAVVAARGRCILGDRGFRASSARIEAVTLPAVARFHPTAARRARRMLDERYPQTRVYGSARAMLKDFPPHDVTALGIDPPTDHSRGYRAAAVALCVAVVGVTYAIALMPAAVGDSASRWWPLLVVLAVGWQAGFVWLLARLLALQGPTITARTPAGGPRRGWPARRRARSRAAGAPPSAGPRSGSPPEGPRA